MKRLTIFKNKSNSALNYPFLERTGTVLRKSRQIVHVAWRCRGCITGTYSVNRLIHIYLCNSGRQPGTV